MCPVEPTAFAPTADVPGRADCVRSRAERVANAMTAFADLHYGRTV